MSPTSPANDEARPDHMVGAGFLMVELRGLEPLTPTLPVWCATSCAIAPRSCAHRSYTTCEYRSKPHFTEAQPRSSGNPIRAGVGGGKPRPRGGLYSGSEPIARRVDELLDGFGER